MKRQKIEVTQRKILGKKVKKLRKEGFLPGNIYGKDFNSVAVQVPLKDFDKIYKQVGETGLVDIELDGKIIPSLIHNVQSDYRRQVLHADFFKVNLKEKVKATVPLEFVGQPKAVSDKIGLLMEIVSEVEVEALPEALPERIEVNVELLAAVDEQIVISDLKVPEGVQILTDSGQVVVKIGELISKEAEEEIAAEEAAAEAAAQEGAEAPTQEGAGQPQAEKPEETKEEKEPQG